MSTLKECLERLERGEAKDNDKRRFIGLCNNNNIGKVLTRDDIEKGKWGFVFESHDPEFNESVNSVYEDLKKKAELTHD